MASGAAQHDARVGDADDAVGAEGTGGQGDRAAAAGPPRGGEGAVDRRGAVGGAVVRHRAEVADVGDHAGPRLPRRAAAAARPADKGELRVREGGPGELRHRGGTTPEPAPGGVPDAAVGGAPVMAPAATPAAPPSTPRLLTEPAYPPALPRPSS